MGGCSVDSVLHQSLQRLARSDPDGSLYVRTSLWIASNGLPSRQNFCLPRFLSSGNCSKTFASGFALKTYSLFSVAVFSKSTSHSAFKSFYASIASHDSSVPALRAFCQAFSTACLALSFGRSNLEITSTKLMSAYRLLSTRSSIWTSSYSCCNIS